MIRHQQHRKGASQANPYRRSGDVFHSHQRGLQRNLPLHQNGCQAGSFYLVFPLLFPQTGCLHEPGSELRTIAPDILCQASDIVLLPFLKPGYVRGLCGGELPESYTDAVRTVLEREQIDPAERNVLVSHQFYTGKNTDSHTVGRR